MMRCMAEIDGLTHPECAVLDALYGLDGHTPLWEIAEGFANSVVGGPPDTAWIATLLSPALASLAANGLMEVRRFATWPAPWEQGTPVHADHLLSESKRPGDWSRNAVPRDVLV